MKRYKIVLLALLFGVQWAWSEGFETAGEGATYSMKELSAIAGSGVELVEDGHYVVSGNVKITAGDSFKMDDGVVVGFSQDVRFTIEGDADFQLSDGSVFTASSGFDRLGSAIRFEGSHIELANCEFDYVGLELMTEGTVRISNCSFYNHDGSSAAALYFIMAGAPAVIKECHFENCRKAAIGSAANASQSMTISDCTLVMNSAANNNVPQINVTASNPLLITGCTVTGNPANTMVGGIGISNFASYDADVTISNCHVEDNRYGLGLVGPAAKIRIENNTFLNNKYETNPMNGGSGISLYDPYQRTCAVVAGNRIEGSLWGVTVIGCKDVNLGRIDVPQTDERYNRGGNSFKDNGNGGVLYDLYNNSANTVYAQGNTWNVGEQTQELIETVVYHHADDASLGEVVYWPAASSANVPSLRVVENADSPLYDLQGRQLVKPVRKGIYISNGKKVVL